jgi:hypothetical protein
MAFLEGLDVPETAEAVRYAEGRGWDLRLLCRCWRDVRFRHYGWL